MLDNQYPINIYPSFQSFKFVSVGPKGAVTKLVRYTQTAINDVYNLGFGDKNDLTDDIDDLVVTNNRDMQKVLQQLLQLYTLLAITFPLLPFLLLEAQQLEQDYIKSESATILKLS